jgi:hypothetical protein
MLASGFTRALLAAGALVLLTAATAAARAEETAEFRATGDPARVYLDGRYVGDTPLDLEVPCAEVTDRQYRIERDGCMPASGVLNARVGGGRVVGAVASLGISLLVKCPNYFVPVEVTLECASLAPPRRVRSEDLQPAPPPVLPTPLPAEPTAAPATLTRAEVEQRLRALDSLRSSGAISEQEYEARRERLLRQL